MANEARVFAEGVEQVIVRQFTVADGTAIAKGALMVQGGNRTAIAHTSTANAERPLGFATMSKVASDGILEIGVQRTSVVDAYIDGVVTTGDFVKISGTTNNRVERIAGVSWSYQEFNEIIGRALESGTDGQQIRIALMLG